MDAWCATDRRCRVTESTLVPVEQIAAADRRTQMRANGTDKAVVKEYAAVLEGGKHALPTIEVYTEDHETYWIVDGWHRYEAHVLCGHDTIPCTVTVGWHDEAVLAAVRANAEHGLRRTNEDKRLAVRTLLMHPEWGKWSDRVIAEKAGVSHPTVKAVRDTLEGSGDVEKFSTRTDSSGRKQPASKPKPAPVEEEPPFEMEDTPEPDAPVEPETEGGTDAALAPLRSADPFGWPMTPDQAERFARTEAIRRGVESHLRSLVKFVKALTIEHVLEMGMGPGWQGRVERDIKKLEGFITEHCYYTVCPECHGGTRTPSEMRTTIDGKCKLCNDIGLYRRNNTMLRSAELKQHREGPKG